MGDTADDADCRYARQNKERRRKFSLSQIEIKIQHAPLHSCWRSNLERFKRRVSVEELR
ncbi:hypothetical protein KIN20_008912, partial [Parelaphostrongylus tenuis]